MTLPSSSLRLLRLPAPRLLRPTSTPYLASAPSIRSYHAHNASTLRLSPVRNSATRSLTRTAPITQPSASTFTSTRSLATSSGKSPADEIVEELQELYENAKDEFEIATDSTDSGTIYAPSDRESARDALNQLLIVFELYTQDHSPTQTAVREQVRAEAEAGAKDEAKEGEEGEEEEGQIVETNFDPSAVEQGVREEVKKRVAQRVRELRNAVELLEERALTE